MKETKHIYIGYLRCCSTGSLDNFGLACHSDTHRNEEHVGDTVLKTAGNESGYRKNDSQYLLCN